MCRAGCTCIFLSYTHLAHLVCYFPYYIGKLTAHYCIALHLQSASLQPIPCLCRAFPCAVPACLCRQIRFRQSVPAQRLAAYLHELCLHRICSPHIIKKRLKASFALGLLLFCCYFVKNRAIPKFLEWDFQSNAQTGYGLHTCALHCCVGLDRAL